MWEWMKKNAKPLTLGLPLLLLVLTLVAAAFPAVNLAVLVEGDALFDHTVSGYELMGSFLGGHPRSAEDLLALKELQPDASLLRVLFFAEGLGWLAALAGLLVDVSLVCSGGRLGEGERVVCTLAAAVGQADHQTVEVLGGLDCAEVDVAADSQ